MRALSCVFLFVLSEARDYDGKFGKIMPDDEDPSPIQRKVDVYPQKFDEPVPFGHISLSGFGDPFAKGKPPVDQLELDMIIPRDSEEAREYLKNNKANIQYVRSNIPKGFTNPRDKYLKSRNVANVQEDKIPELKWYSLADMHQRNLMMPAATRGRSRKKYKNERNRATSVVHQHNGSKAQFFARNTFDLKVNQKVQKYNFTTCDEFGVGAIFSPKDIVNIDWVPFYIWSIEGYPISIVHKFRIPTQKLVEEFRIKFGKLLPKAVDWTQVKLYMEGMTDMLLIAADRKGLFDAIPRHELPDGAANLNITLPALTIRLKIEDPYLVMMYCEDYFAAVMAISGNEPTIYSEMKAEAATIKFVGPGQPAWRDYEGEKEKLKDIENRRIAEESAKYLEALESIPPVGQFD